MSVEDDESMLHTFNRGYALLCYYDEGMIYVNVLIRHVGFRRKMIFLKFRVDFFVYPRESLVEPAAARPSHCSLMLDDGSDLPIPFHLPCAWPFSGDV